MKNLAFGQFQVGGLDYFVWMHTAESPSAGEWKVSIDALRAYARQNPGFERYRGLVLTDGGAPSVVQRSDLNELYAGRPVRVAVISDNPLVRAVITALSWFGLKIKPFASKQIGNALEHIELRDAQRTQLWKELTRLERECERIDVFRAATRTLESDPSQKQPQA